MITLQQGLTALHLGMKLEAGVSDHGYPFIKLASYRDLSVAVMYCTDIAGRLTLARNPTKLRLPYILSSPIEIMRMIEYIGADATFTNQQEPIHYIHRQKEENHA
jgi:hypothetical protein